MDVKPRTLLSRWLIRHGITSEALAGQTGYSVSAVNAWRLGLRRPSKGARVLLAQALGISERAIERILAMEANDRT